MHVAAIIKVERPEVGHHEGWLLGRAPKTVHLKQQKHSTTRHSKARQRLHAICIYSLIILFCSDITLSSPIPTQMGKEDKISYITSLQKNTQLWR